MIVFYTLILLVMKMIVYQKNLPHPHHINAIFMWKRKIFKGGIEKKSKEHVKLFPDFEKFKFLNKCSNFSSYFVGVPVTVQIK